MNNAKKNPTTQAISIFFHTDPKVNVTYIELIIKIKQKNKLMKEPQHKSFESSALFNEDGY